MALVNSSISPMRVSRTGTIPLVGSDQFIANLETAKPRFANQPKRHPRHSAILNRLAVFGDNRHARAQS
jgi:hypothetical protein